MSHHNAGPIIDVQELAAAVPAHLAAPTAPSGRSQLEWSRHFLEDAVRIALNSRDADQMEALHSQFTDYVAALVHISGMTREEAVRSACEVVEQTLGGAGPAGGERRRAG